MRELPKKVSVVGTGISGIGAVKFLLSQGCSVFVSDSAPEEVVRTRLTEAGVVDGVTYEGGGHSDHLFDSELVILSPGIASDSKLCQQLRVEGIETINDVELGYFFSESPFVAVTGSNGKSTTVSLIAHTLNGGGRKASVCGNIGIPVTSVAPYLKADDVAVCEISSFQMEQVDSFQPAVSLILNLSPNHLDRHSSLEEYYGLKIKLAQMTRPGGLVVLNGGSAELVELGRSIKGRRVVYFGEVQHGYDSVVIAADHICFIDPRGVISIYCSTADFPLAGDHNLLNLLASAAVAKEFGVTGEEFSERFKTFKALPHRMQYVCSRKGITFYNDSKATTVDSMIRAVSGFPAHRVRLIVGGRDKGGDFAAAGSIIKKQVVKAYLIGEAKERVADEWESIIPLEQFDSMEDALSTAVSESSEGDIVLLSPACSSFDMFKSFEDRGERFSSLAMEV